MENKIVFLKFKKNDLIDDTGKQFEFPKAIYDDFFGLKQEEEKIKFVYKDSGINSSLNEKSIEISLKKSEQRSDYKMYSNGGGHSPFKKFLLIDLNLTEKNVDDYYALEKKSDKEYNFYYFPKEATIEEISKILILDKKEVKFIESFPSKSPLILYGPPGTGKTHKMQTEYIANYLNHFVTTFHQSFSYEEFVEGLKAKVNDKGDVVYEIEKGIFYQACEKAAKLAGYGNLQEMIKDGGAKLKDAELTCENTVLLCIDEINRANVSAVFGDLISLIEPSKRLSAEFEMKVMLPYSKEVFAVPKNLLIVGTMNTADRSIQLLDSALRRRFEFVELLPDYEKIENENARKLLEAMNNRIRALLGKNYQIGHSYFINIKSDDGDEKILEVLRENIISLLEEYFYDEAEKIVAVLNDADAHNFYVEDKEVENFINSYSDYDDEKKVYRHKEKYAEKNAEEIIANIIGKKENL